MKTRTHMIEAIHLLGQKADNFVKEKNELSKTELEYARSCCQQAISKALSEKKESLGECGAIVLEAAQEIRRVPAILEALGEAGIATLLPKDSL